MIRTYKYRLYTNKSQRDALDFILWQQRILYNAALEQRKRVYEETGKGISYVEQCTFGTKGVPIPTPSAWSMQPVCSNSCAVWIRRIERSSGA